MPLISNAFAFAPAPTTGTAGTESTLMNFLPIALMFVLVYLLMLRPQMKRQKEHRNMLAAMAKGDEIVTSGGVLGKITKLGDTYVGVEIANGVEISVQKASITAVLPKGTIKSL